MNFKLSEDFSNLNLRDLRRSSSAEKPDSPAAAAEVEVLSLTLAASTTVTARLGTNFKLKWQRTLKKTGIEIEVTGCDTSDIRSLW